MRFLRLALAILAVAVPLACGSSAAPDAGDTTPIVSPLELPLSLRTTPAFQASNAVLVEIGAHEIRLDHQSVAQLDGGDIPAAQLRDNAIPALARALAGRANKSRAAIRAHAMVPYRTTLQVLKTLAEAGTREVGFAVRRIGGSGADEGWIAINGIKVVPENDDEVQFDAVVTPPAWDDFVHAWEDVTAACDQADESDCSRRNDFVATGGRVQVRLRARGDGINVQFSRVGAPPPAPIAPPRDEDIEQMGVDKTRPTKLNRRGPAAQRWNDRDAGMIDPRTEALFTMRARQATTAPSPISGILRPVCGTRTCGVVVVADPTTNTGNLVSLLGAAFPDGAGTPSVAFQIPR